MNGIKTLYLPIDTTNIGKLFSLGCICPSEYFDRWITDPQSLPIRKYSILLCAEKYTDQTSCSLEIVFTEEEEKFVKKISDDFYTLHTPLPISRIKKIFFRDNKQREITIHDIIRGDAFIPEHLIEIDKSSTFVQIAQLPNVSENINIENAWEEQKEKTDIFKKIIGGFALMRIGGDQYKDYSTNYFQTLSKLNKIINNYLLLSNYQFNNYLSHFIDNAGRTKDSFIYKSVNIDFVSNLASSEDIQIEKKHGNIIFDKITNEKIYVAAILASYGNDKGKRKSIDKFILDLSNGKFKNEFIEELCLLFGINQGYDAFRNSYKFEEKQVDVKYKLDSQIDYYTIESVYQYVFNNRVSKDKFEHLDNWCPMYSGENVNRMEYNTYRILDKDIIFEKKAVVGSQEYIQELLPSLPGEDVYYEIANVFISTFPTDLRPAKDKAKHYIKEKLHSSIQTIVEKTVHRVNEDIVLEYHEDKKVLLKEIHYLKDEIEKLSNENKKLLDIKEIDNEFPRPIARKDDPSKIFNTKYSSYDRQSLEKDYDSIKDNELKNMLKEYNIQFKNNKGYLIKLLLDAKLSENR